MAGYTRQSVADIINGADITAPPVNAEFNQLASAFNGSTGHSHDGSTGNAPKIDLTTSVSGYLPAVHGGVGGKNNLAAITNPTATDDAGDGYAPGSLWENTTTGRVFICVGNTANAAVWRELVQVETSNVIKPITHDTIDLGTPAVRFQDLWLSGGIGAAGNVSVGGTLSVTGATTLTGAATANGGLTVNGTTSLAGSVTIGDPLSTLDTIAVAAGFTSNLVPDTNAGVNLGTSTKQWNNLYIDGTATIDTLTVDENATVAGTLGVTGTSTLSTANITNITATGTINLAGATVSNLGTVTTAAIGGGSLNNVVIGGSTPAAITGTTITGTSLVGPLTGNVTGNVTGNLTGNVTGDVTGDLTGNVTATSGTSNFTNVTISGQLNMDATSAATITNLTAPSSDLDAATKKYVDDAIDDLLDGAPGTLDTLNELAAAINDDASAYNTLNTAIGNKLPKAGGTMSGAINMGGQKITNAANPTAAQDLATKHYIDTTYIDYSSAADAANDAEKLAVNAEDVQYTLSDGSTTGYSALHYAAKAAASYDSFDDRYLGSKASDPTLDNDNNALITGALYFDSTNGVMKVYNGSEWANASSSIEGIKSNFYYTATSGQTAFSGTDDNSNTLVIDKAGLVNVYMNGVRLHEDDYTVSAAGDSVTLAAGAATGDLIYLEVFGNFAGQSGADVAITGGSITGLDELGIGEASPDRSLHISASVPAIKLEDTDVAGLYHEIVPTAAGQVQFKVDAGNVQANSKFVAVIDGAERLKVDTSGIDVIGTVTADGLTVDGNITNNAGLKIKGYYSNASGDGYNANLGVTGNETYLQSMNGTATNSLNIDGSTIKFRSGTFNEAMRIDSNGNVGISTTNPANLLSVHGSANDLSIISAQAGTSANSEITLGGFDANKTDISAILTGSVFGGIIQGGNNGKLVFALRDNDVSDSFEWISGSGNWTTDATYDYRMMELRADGVLKTYGAAVFNEGGADADFRVESDSNTHMFFVDGGDEQIRIKNNTSSRAGDLLFGANATRGDVDQPTGTKINMYSGNSNHLMGMEGGGMYFTTDQQIRHYYKSGATFANLMTVASGGTVFNEDSGDRDFRVESDGNNNMIFVNGGSNRVSIGMAGGSEVFNVKGSVQLDHEGSDSFAKIVGPDNRTLKVVLRANDDNDAFVVEDNRSSGSERLTVNAGGEMVVNDTSADYDFRVESDTNSNAIFLDAGSNVLHFMGSTYGAASTSTGCYISNAGQFIAKGAGSHYFNRTDANGPVLEFYRGTANVGSLDNRSTTSFAIDLHKGYAGLTGSTTGGGAVLPYTNNAIVDDGIDLGYSGGRYDNIYATNGTINTSDERDKQQVAVLTDAEILAAKALSKLFKTYKWNSAVTEKGAAARTHTGVIAQQVEQAMTDAGLDAGDYGFYIDQTWYETPAGDEADADTEGAIEKNRKGIRYPELLSFIGAATEQRLTSIEARLDALEA